MGKAPRKFRVWDGERMNDPEEDFHHYHIGPHGELRLEYIVDCPSHDEPVVTLDNPWERLDDADAPIAMMYTGLTDAEGTEVYEGDILDWRGKERFRVVFENGSFVFETDAIPAELVPEMIRESKIVGNVPQNPDLLRQTN